MYEKETLQIIYQSLGIFLIIFAPLLLGFISLLVLKYKPKNLKRFKKIFLENFKD